MKQIYINAIIVAQGWYLNASEVSKPMYKRLLDEAVKNYENFMKE
jgi:hypothetical protein